MNKKVAWGLGIGAVLVTGIGVAVYIKVKKNKQDKLDAAARQSYETYQFEVGRTKQQETQFGNPVNKNQLDLQNIMSGLIKPQAPIRTSEPDSDYTTSGWDYEKDMPIFSKAPSTDLDSQPYYRNPDDNDITYYEDYYKNY